MVARFHFQPSEVWDMTLEELWFWLEGAMWLNTPEKPAAPEDTEAMAQLEAQGMGGGF